MRLCGDGACQTDPMRQRGAPCLASLVLVMAAVLVVAGSSPAGAAPSTLAAVHDRYEPGEVATLVGYVVPANQSGGLEDAPFFAFLRAGETVLPLGQLALRPAPTLGPQAIRAQATFPVPEQLEPGRYELFFCNEPCVKSLGDLVGATMNVGVDPLEPITREWPADEPELANVSPGARIVPPAVVLPPTAVAPPTTIPPAPPRTIPIQVEIRPVPPQPGSDRGVNTGPLVAGAAIALLCVGMVLAALRDS